MGNTRKEQKERLQQLSLRLGLTIRDIARIADMSEATLYHITDQTRGISDRTASKICYHLEREKGVVVNREWILTGEGEMIDEKHSLPYTEEDTQPRIMEDGKDYREKYYELLEKYSELQDKYYKLIGK